MEDAWAHLQPVVSRAQRVDDCAGPANTTPPGPTQRVDVWNALLACRGSEQIPLKLRKQIDETINGPGNFQVPYDASRSAIADVNQTTATLERQKRIVAAKTEEIAKAAPLRSAFNELDALTNMWALGHGALVGLPPSLMQILLSFSAGLFGALLVTLVLVVYPNSAVGASGASLEARIFLGGLIALGVFIVLGGGAAILGSGAPFDESKANFMTFSAVGVLAGMFSDRVAAWMSKRADAFFQ
jgi:hypothetical protein